MGIVIHNVVFVWMLTIHSVLFLSSCSSGSGENAPGEGNLNWAIRIGGQDFERPGSILVRTDGTILVLGGFVDEVTFGRGEKNETILDPTDGYSDFIAEYNSNGKLTWAKLIGPASIHTALTNGHSCSVGSFSVPRNLARTLILLLILCLPR